MACKVKIKLQEATLATRPERKPNIEDRKHLTILLRTTQVDYYRLLPTHDGWVIVTANMRESEKLLKDEIIKKLTEIKMELVLPAELRARRTLVLKKCDDGLFEEDKNNIIQEIIEAKPYIQHDIEDIYMMPQHSIMKIKFKTIEAANKIQQEGIKLFGASIPTHQIERERYATPIQCMRCYKYDHTTQSCSETTILCSECSSTSHTWKNCGATVPKCTQCQGQHRTFSLLCTKRKEAVNKAIEERTLQEDVSANRSYSNILKPTIKQTNEAVRKTLTETSKEVLQEDIKRAVHEEIKLLHEALKRSLHGVITQELALHTATLREEIKELKEELKKVNERRVIRITKRRMDHITSQGNETQDETTVIFQN